MRNCPYTFYNSSCISLKELFFTNKKNLMRWKSKALQKRTEKINVCLPRKNSKLKKCNFAYILLNICIVFVETVFCTDCVASFERFFLKSYVDTDTTPKPFILKEFYCYFFDKITLLKMEFNKVFKFLIYLLKKDE